VGEQVEGLEDDPDPPPDPVDVDALRGDLLAFDVDPAGVDRLEEVDAPQQRGLAGAGRADQADDLVLGDDQVDAPQHLERPERLVEPLDPERLAGGDRHERNPSIRPRRAAPLRAPTAAA
jgi:hypothetical protein